MNKVNLMNLSIKKATISIVLFCIIVYLPILGHDFITGWDDGWQVINKYTDTLSWYNLKLIFSDYYSGQYSPINQLLYTLIYYLFGYNSLCFHLLSLILHTLNALLVFLIVHRVLNLNMQTKTGVEQRIILISFFVALLFAVHPLQVESVAWISASKIVVYSFFYLLAIWFYLCYIQKEKIFYYILMLLCFMLSFGGKEQAITFPLCMIWVDLVCRRNFRNGVFWCEKMPVVLLTLIFVNVTLEANGYGNTELLGQDNSYTLLQRFIFACYSLCEYVVKTCFPFNLLYIYPFPITVGETLPLRFWMYPCLLLLVGGCFWKFWKQRPVWLGLAWFLIHIGLMLHIIPMPRVGIVADRYIYLALPGLLFVIVWYFFVILDTFPKIRKLWIGMAIVWILFIGVKAHVTTYTWHDTTTLKLKMNDLLEQRAKKQHEFGK